MKKIFMILPFAISICLTACGDMSDKVSQTTSTIEIGSRFNVKQSFSCDDDVTIQLKSNEDIDTSILGNKSATFVISDGKNKEEKDYSFNIIDTKPPTINTKDITIYANSKFNPKKYVQCTDNSGEKIKPSIKTNNVDTTTEGTYSVTYEASDSSGNMAEQNMTVDVISIRTVADAMDLVDQFISKKNTQILRTIKMNWMQYLLEENILAHQILIQIGFYLYILKYIYYKTHSKKITLKQMA